MQGRTCSSGVTDRTGVTPARRGAFGLYHFAILLPDRSALGRFAAHIASLGIRIGMADHLVSESLYLSDPDGLGIEVYADRPPSAWKRNGRELMMATDPLDIDNVIAAGAGDPWDGLPAGTTMGHVHLHVGSLELAEAFYHRVLGFDKRCGRTLAHCSCRLPGITIISARMCGRRALRRRPIAHNFWSGSSYCPHNRRGSCGRRECSSSWPRY